MSKKLVVPGDFSQFAYRRGDPACSAVIKQEFEDFQVDEVLGFEPTGAGEHLYLRIRKQDLGTTDAALSLARTLGTRTADIGYSGMKDRRAITSQWFSVPERSARGLRAGDRLGAGMELLEIRANDRKLRIGSHRANLFQIRLRNLAGDRDDLQARLETAARDGVPNYFGPQRLGRALSNVSQAQDYFRAFDDMRERRRPPTARKRMLLSAARSFLFNAILSRRVTEGTWCSLLPGEVLNLNGTRRLFSVAGESELAALAERLQSLDIHPTGLLAGAVKDSDPYRATGAVATLEAEVLADFPILGEGLVAAGLQASRRALRLVPDDLTVASTQDDTLVIRFSLGAGGYATSLLRELVRF